MRIAIILFYLCVASISSFADSTDIYTASSVRYVRFRDLAQDTLNFQGIDTTLNGFQRFSPLDRNEIPYIYLGNLGTAYRPLFFQMDDVIGFNTGRHAFDAYLTHPADLRFYRAQSPYTKLMYIWNQKKEQVFKLTFAQNITPRLNYAINFGKLVSDGDYQRQKSNHLNFDGSLWYHSKNRRYTILAGYIANDLKIQENGGIKNDSIFSVSSNLRTDFEPVYLNHAENRIAVSHIFYQQAYAFGNRDTLKIDTFAVPVVHPRHRFAHAIDYEHDKFKYIEKGIDSAVYPFIFLDSAKTYDILEIKSLKNEVNYDYFARNTQWHAIKLNRFNLGVDHKIIQVDNLSFDTTWTQLTLKSGLGLLINKKYDFQYQYHQIVSEDFEGDNHSRFLFTVYLKKNISHLEATTDLIRTSPDLMSSHLRSNHYQWDNEFDAIQKYHYTFGFVDKSFDLSAKVFYTQVKGLIYYNDVSLPLQLDEMASVYGIALKKNMALGKFHLENTLYVQNTDHEEIIRQPSIHTYNSCYFQSFVFKKALLLRTGFDVRYYTAYDGYDYNPALAQFIAEPEQDFGDYPVVDFFITAKVKRALLMLKIDHLNDKLTKKGYYQIPRYPLPERAFKIGISWSFYD